MLFSCQKPLAGKAVAFPEEAVSYWDFEDTTDDGTAADAVVTRGNDATINGGAAYVTGKYGKAIQLDGTDDYLEVADDASLDLGTGDFTLSLWVKRGEKGSGKGHTLLSKSDSSPTAGNSLFFNIADSGSEIDKAVLALSESASGSLVTTKIVSRESLGTEWKHLVAVRRGTTLELYVDGKLDATAAGQLVKISSTGNLFIGKSFLSPEKYLKGLLDEVRVYNRALSAEEIKLLYLPPEPTQYIARWNFEDEGNLIKEERGAYDGILVPKTGGKWSKTSVRAGTASQAQAVHFTGTSNEMVVVNASLVPGQGPEILPAGLKITDELTVSAWVKAARRPLDGRVVVSTQSGDNGWLFGAEGGADSFSLRVGSVAAVDNNFFAEHLDEWVQVVGVYKGVATDNELRLYVNGEETGVLAANIPASVSYDTSDSLTPATWGPSTRLTVGADREGERAWEGDIDDLRIYDRALTPQQVKALYYAGTSADCFNKFCPSALAVEQLPLVAEDTSSVQQTRMALAAYPEGVSSGATLSGAPDLALAQKTSFTTVSTLTTDNDVLYFAHNNKIYFVSLTQRDAWSTATELQLISAADNQAKATLSLSASPTERLLLGPGQVAVNLEGDATPEAYLQSFGYYDTDSTLGLTLGATPVMNFDAAATWRISLLSGQPQQFFFDNEVHNLNFARLPDGSYVVFVDGEEYKFASTADAAQTHAFDQLGTQKVQMSAKVLSGDLGVFEFVRTAQELANTYDETLTKEQSLTLSNRVLRICANDPLVLAAVTLCEGNIESFDVVDGEPKKVESLRAPLGVSGAIDVRATAGDAEFSSTLFYYARPVSGEKKVEALHIFNLDVNPTYEYALYFANNLVQGKRLALQLNSEYYLLEMDDTSVQFLELTNLKLTKISGGSGVVYHPVGDQEVVRFDLPLNQQINIRLETTPQLRYILRKTAGAVSEEVNLVNKLQTSVTSYGAVKITDNGGEVKVEILSLDGSDQSTLQTSMVVHSSAAPAGSQQLSFGVPTPLVKSTETRLLNDAGSTHTSKEAGLLLHYNRFEPGGTVDEPRVTKYADVYLSYDLETAGTAGTDHRFTDAEFIIPVLKGNKLALKAAGKYYLLIYAQPWTGKVTGGFAVDQLRLKSFDETSDILPQVSEAGTTITFDLGNDNSIELVLDTATNTIRFRQVTLAAALATVAKSVSLMNELQTTLTTISPVQFTDVETAAGTDALLSIHTEDSKFLREEMRVASSIDTDADTDSDPDDLRLLDDVPKAWGKVTAAAGFDRGEVLLIYTTFEAQKGIYTKSAEVYLLYDLDEGAKTRPFTANDLVLPLVEQGKKIALKYKETYYLLSYSGTLGEGFRYNKLRLKPLTGSQLQPISGESSVSFTVSGGVIVVKFDTTARTVTFTSVLEGKAVKTFTPEKEFKTELPPFSLTPGADNVLEVRDNLLYNCDLPDTRTFAESFFLCWKARGSATVDQGYFAKAQPIDAESAENTDADPDDVPADVVLLYRGKKATGEKEVTAQYLFAHLRPGEVSAAFDWDLFSGNLAQRKEPLVRLKETYYELLGSGSMDGFALRSLGGVTFDQRRTISEQEGRKEVQVVVNETMVVNFTQQLDPVTKELELVMRLQDYVVVTPRGIQQQLAAGEPLRFVPSLGAPQYGVFAESAVVGGTPLDGVVMVTLGEREMDGTTEIFPPIYQGRIPVGEKRSILLSNKEVVTVEAVAVDPAGVTVLVHR